MLRIFFILGILLTWMCSCQTSSTVQTEETTAQDSVVSKVVNVYTHRHYESDEQLFKAFTEKTGIEVKVVKSDADELMKRLEEEGENSPADLLITVDAGRLFRAKESGLVQAVQTEVLAANIPEKFRDKDGYWHGMTSRARVIVYSKDRVKEGAIQTYEDLTLPKWKGKVLVRSSANIYNQSLLASIIAHKGAEEAKKWCEGVVKNMARTPTGNDRQQIEAIAAGEGDLALVNTYYLGMMLNDEDPAKKEAAEKVGILFPNQNDRGTHVNVSGMSLCKYAPNKENAILLMEFLSEKSSQESFAKNGYEYPVNPQAMTSELLSSWGTFKSDTLSFEQLGALNTEAVKVFDQAGWK